MIKRVLVRGPALTQSGYGEHTRFLLRSLRASPEKFDIYLVALNWGQTGWLSEDTEERRWIDSLVMKTHQYAQSGGQFDMSIQVSIPNEWERVAPYNVGVTAGIETTKVAPIWLQKANEMDKVITISEHAKKGFVDTLYHGQNPQTGQEVRLDCKVPVEIARYPVKTHKDIDPIIDLEYDFNFLAIAQWGPRKNLVNMVKWFVEENIDQEVGLVLKTSIKNNSIMDRVHIESVIKGCIPSIEDRKCKIYLLHGDLSEDEVHSLYRHPKIKAMISTTHGEGYGLPLFEAAYTGLPIIAPAWSGHLDFLHVPFDSKAKKNKDKRVMKPMYAEVDFDMAPVQEAVLWKDVIEKDMFWCYAKEGSFKLRMRQVRKSYDKWLQKAKTLQEWVLTEFESEKMHTHFADLIYPDSLMTQEELDWQSALSEIEVS